MSTRNSGMAKWAYPLVIAGLVVGLVANVQAYQAVKVANGGTITGKVVFKGTPPAAKKMKITKDKKVCGTERTVEDLVIGSGNGVRWAVASLDISKGNGINPKAKVEIDQKGCTYKPHVVLVPAGGTLTAKNSDGILHNIHTYSKVNRSVNKAQPKFKKRLKIRKTFKKPELISVRCDAHSWMQGYILVHEHPYNAVSGADGSFKIADVPPGSYKLKVWHEKLGTVTKDIKVEAGKEASVTFEMSM